MNICLNVTSFMNDPYHQFHQQFTYEFFVRMLFSLVTCTYKKGRSYEKFVCKVMMKLTPAVNFIKVKHANFLYERRFSSYILALSKNLYVKCWWNWHLDVDEVLVYHPKWKCDLRCSWRGSNFFLIVCMFFLLEKKHNGKDMQIFFLLTLLSSHGQFQMKIHLGLSKCFYNFTRILYSSKRLQIFSFYLTPLKFKEWKLLILKHNLRINVTIKIY